MNKESAPEPSEPFILTPSGAMSVHLPDSTRTITVETQQGCCLSLWSSSDGKRWFVLVGIDRPTGMSANNLEHVALANSSEVFRMRLALIRDAWRVTPDDGPSNITLNLHADGLTELVVSGASKITEDAIEKATRLLLQLGIESGGMLDTYVWEPLRDDIARLIMNNPGEYDDGLKMAANYVINRSKIVRPHAFAVYLEHDLAKSIMELAGKPRS